LKFCNTEIEIIKNLDKAKTPLLRATLWLRPDFVRHRVRKYYGFLAML